MRISSLTSSSPADSPARRASFSIAAEVISWPSAMTERLRRLEVDRLARFPLERVHLALNRAGVFVGGNLDVTNLGHRLDGTAELGDAEAAERQDEEGHDDPHASAHSLFLRHVSAL